MSEGYLITNCSLKNATQVEILAKSIRFFDAERPISIIVDRAGVKDLICHIDEEIVVDENQDMPTANYYHSLLSSPYEKTIAFQPDQILTNFNPAVWENLRGMNSIVIPKTRSSFNGEKITPDVYHNSAIEEKSFNDSTTLNAIFFNKSKGCDYVFGMAVVIASQYNQNEFIDFFADMPGNSMPPFPEHLWPEWVMTLMSRILNVKLSKFDFVDCIDLSIRENSYVNDNWSKRPWPEFLSYWVNDQGSIKIENYVQLGLIKYATSSWLTEATLTNLRKKYT